MYGGKLKLKKKTDPDNDKTLSAEFVYSDVEILDRYRELCAEAAENPGQPVEELREVAADVCRVLGKNI